MSQVHKRADDGGIDRDRSNTSILKRKKVPESSDILELFSTKVSVLLTGVHHILSHGCGSSWHSGFHS